MKKLLIVILAAGVGAGIASLMTARLLREREAARLSEQQAVWQAERAALEAALAEAQGRPQVVASPAIRPTSAPVPAKLSPVEIVAKLRALASAPAGQTRSVRQAIHGLEDLIAIGPEALPAIREFLARNEDIDFVPPKGTRGVGEDLIPVSLRFGLFDAVKQIGGPDAEKLLAEVLSTTGRGLEVHWLAKALQEMAPNKHREVALTAARDLLARPLPAGSAGPLDRNERDVLFAVLTMYGDTSYVSAAQEQMLRADGQVDRSTLKYLQQSLGHQAVPIAARWYDDPRITDPARKEPFARLALSYVGADAQANEFYERAINDQTLSKSHRKNLIEDLNQDGFPDTKNLSARDLPLIQNRIALIENMAPGATDPINAAAFQEAYKDLLKMRDRVMRPPQAQ